jgi:hypothetical protein
VALAVAALFARENDQRQIAEDSVLRHGMPPREVLDRPLALARFRVIDRRERLGPSTELLRLLREPRVDRREFVGAGGSRTGWWRPILREHRFARFRDRSTTGALEETENAVRNGDRLVLGDGLGENETRDVAPVRLRELPDDRSAVGMPDEDERPLLAEPVERVSQLEIDLCEGPRLRSRVAPGVAGAVVGTDASKPQHAVLNEGPVERKVPEPVFDHHGRPPGAGTEDVKSMPPEIDEASGRPRSGGPRGDGGCRDREQERRNPSGLAHGCTA